MNLHGLDLFGEPIQPKLAGPLAERFIFPPFTVLDGRSIEWIERKRLWISHGIESEIGRGENLLSFSKALLNQGVNEERSNTSIFDPVLCELMYSWFCPPKGQIIDPFAGGSVRGIVATMLGNQYWGCDLREEQIEANKKQSRDPVWVSGDSEQMLKDAPEADFVFSCPPYGNLEKYSDNENDLSNMSHESFVDKYARIIKLAIGKLKDNRFAAFVVGDFRSKEGFYRGFVGETVNAFESAGAKFYNDAILATPVGTAPLRVTRQFDSTRKFAKVHQNILVFVKGNPKKAAERINNEFQ